MNNIENALIALAVANSLLKDYIPQVDVMEMSDKEYIEYMQSEEFEF